MEEEMFMMSCKERLQAVPQCDNTLEYWENEESENILENIDPLAKKRSCKVHKISSEEHKELPDELSNASSAESEDDTEIDLEEPLNSLEKCITIPVEITEKKLSEPVKLDASKAKTSSSNIVKVKDQKPATLKVKNRSTIHSHSVCSPGTKPKTANVSPKRKPRSTIPSHIVSKRSTLEVKISGPKKVSRNKASTATKRSSLGKAGTSQTKLNKSDTNSKKVAKDESKTTVKKNVNKKEATGERSLHSGRKKPIKKVKPDGTTTKTVKKASTVKHSVKKVPSNKSGAHSPGLINRHIAKRKESHSSIKIVKKRCCHYDDEDDNEDSSNELECHCSDCSSDCSSSSDSEESHGSFSYDCNCNCHCACDC